ncbi:hypothetical protein KF840_08610 [bacterium]|nr:hypothetical protein [bacterium]
MVAPAAHLVCVPNAAGTAAEAMALAHRSLYQNKHLAPHRFDDADVVQVSARCRLLLCGHGDLEVAPTVATSNRCGPALDAPYQAALNRFAPMPFAQQAKISHSEPQPVPRCG